MTREEIHAKLGAIFKEASAAGKTIFEYAPNIEGAEAYRSLAKEIINGI